MKVRLGAYYFDGWTGNLNNPHFNGLPNGAFQGREPLSGWQDGSACAVEQQLAWAHNDGIDFFVFDWYFNASVFDSWQPENLNSALEITHTLPNRHGMHYALLYANGSPFVAQPRDWTTLIANWMPYLTDPAYARVNGKPVIFVYDFVAMHNTFGSATAVSNAWNELRAAAVANGLPGVFIVGEHVPVPGSSGQDALFPDWTWTKADGYDALSNYGYADTVASVSGANQFSSLASTGQWIWNQCALKCGLPMIPDAMDGWDARPGGSGYWLTHWFTRSPQDVASFVKTAISAANGNPNLRVEPPPAAPMVMIEAWNELQEGSYIVPTVGDGNSYGDAIASLFAH